MKIWPWVLLGVGVSVVIWMPKNTLKYFSAVEFGIYWPWMNADLLLKLDQFRERWGHPVKISPAPGSVGRVTGSTYHNYITHKTVKAIDVMPMVKENGVLRGCNDGELRDAFDLAKKIFGGVGIYPEWKPFPGLHLDVRERPASGRVATWAGIKNLDGEQVYVAAEAIV